MYPAHAHHGGGVAQNTVNGQNWQHQRGVEGRGCVGGDVGAREERGEYM